MLRIYEGTSGARAPSGRLDFEDMLGLALRLFDEHPDAVHGRPLAVLRVHCGRVPGREPAAGGASRPVARRAATTSVSWATTTRRSTRLPALRPSTSWASRGGSRRPRSSVWRTNYRSSPEVLDFANRLAAHLGGFRKTLRAARPSGPAPVARAEPDEKAEVGAVVRPSGVSATRRPCRSRRSRCCTGSTPDPSRSRRLSPTPASRTRCATARSSGDRDRDRCAPAAAALGRRVRGRDRRSPSPTARLRRRGVARTRTKRSRVRPTSRDMRSPRHGVRGGRTPTATRPRSSPSWQVGSPLSTAAGASTSSPTTGRRA